MPDTSSASHGQVIAKITCPPIIYVNKMPSIGTHRRLNSSVPIVLSLKNESRSDIMLEEPTICQVHFWELFDSEETLIETQPYQTMCPMMVVFKKLAVDQAFTEDDPKNTIVLNSKHLLDDAEYTIKYLFWSCPCETKFKTKWVE